MAQIYIQTEDAARILRRLEVSLSKEQLAVAQSRAINKTLGKARTQARRSITRVYNISQRYLKTINFIPATPTGQYAVTGKLYALRKPIPLDAFAAKQETGTGSRRITRKGALKVVSYKRAKSNPTTGVSIEIFKGSRIVIPFAFMIPGGAVRVFARGQYNTGGQYGFVQRIQRVNKSGNDTPIKPLITVSEYGTMINKDVLGEIGGRTKEWYPESLENQIMFLLSQV
jgi:hypothetical protein